MKSMSLGEKHYSNFGLPKQGHKSSSVALLELHLFSLPLFFFLTSRLSQAEVRKQNVIV